MSRNSGDIDAKNTRGRGVGKISQVDANSLLGISTNLKMCRSIVGTAIQQLGAIPLGIV